MALEGKFIAETFNAGADLSAAQYKIVKIDTAANKQVVLQASSGARGDGVLMNKPTANQPAMVGIIGTMKALAGATIASAGIELMVDTTSRLITATSTNHVFGISLNGAAVGEFVEFVRIEYVKP